MRHIYFVILFLLSGLFSMGQKNKSDSINNLPQAAASKLDSMIFRVVSGDTVNEERSMGSCFQKWKHLLILFADLTCPYCEFKDKTHLNDAIELVRSLEKRYPEKFNVLFLQYFDESIKSHPSFDSIQNLINYTKITWLTGLSDFYFLRSYAINTCPSIILLNDRRRLPVNTPKEVERILSSKR